MITLILVCQGLPGSVAIGSFQSTPSPQDNGLLQVCDGETISLSCSHENTASGISRWVFSPPLDCSFIVDHASPDLSRGCGPFQLETATMNNGTLMSTVAATADTTITGTVVECRDSGGISFNVIGNISICVLGKQYTACVL